MEIFCPFSFLFAQTEVVWLSVGNIIFYAWLWAWWSISAFKGKIRKKFAYINP